MLGWLGQQWDSLRTWQQTRTSNDLWPTSEPCCGHFHSSGPILCSYKCITQRHCSIQGCFLDTQLRPSEAWCQECAVNHLGENELSPGAWQFQMTFFVLWKRGVELPGRVCSTTTDGQLDSHEAAFWCHPHATYASPCGYDFLEIGDSHRPPQPSP